MALFMVGEMRKKRGEEREGDENAFAHFPFPENLTLSPLLFLLSANSIPFQSPGERSENASSYYITYAAHQSDRV